jgi:hypothetical protein
MPITSSEHGVSGVGWGGYHPREPRQKSKAEQSVERRRELAKKFPGDINELIALAADSKVRVQRLPPAPHPDELPDPAPEVAEGPCQKWCSVRKA